MILFITAPSSTMGVLSLIQSTFVAVDMPSGQSRPQGGECAICLVDGGERRGRQVAWHGVGGGFDAVKQGRGDAVELSGGNPAGGPVWVAPCNGGKIDLPVEVHRHKMVEQRLHHEVGEG